MTAVVRAQGKGFDYLIDAATSISWEMSSPRVSGTHVLLAALDALDDKGVEALRHAGLAKADLLNAAHGPIAGEQPGRELDAYVDRAQRLASSQSRLPTIADLAEAVVLTLFQDDSIYGSSPLRTSRVLRAELTRNWGLADDAAKTLQRFDSTRATVAGAVRDAPIRNLRTVGVGEKVGAAFRTLAEWAVLPVIVMIFAPGFIIRGAARHIIVLLQRRRRFGNLLDFAAGKVVVAPAPTSRSAVVLLLGPALLSLMVGLCALIAVSVEVLVSGTPALIGFNEADDFGRLAGVGPDGLDETGVLAVLLASGGPGVMIWVGVSALYTAFPSYRELRVVLRDINLIGGWCRLVRIPVLPLLAVAFIASPIERFTEKVFRGNALVGPGFVGAFLGAGLAVLLSNLLLAT